MNEEQINILCTGYLKNKLIDDLLFIFVKLLYDPTDFWKENCYAQKIINDKRLIIVNQGKNDYLIESNHCKIKNKTHVWNFTIGIPYDVKPKQHYFTTRLWIGFGDTLLHQTKNISNATNGMIRCNASLKELQELLPDYDCYKCGNKSMIYCCRLAHFTVVLTNTNLMYVYFMDPVTGYHTDTNYDITSQVPHNASKNLKITCNDKIILKMNRSYYTESWAYDRIFQWEKERLKHLDFL